MSHTLIQPEDLALRVSIEGQVLVQGIPYHVDRVTWLDKNKTGGLIYLKGFGCGGFDLKNCPFQVKDFRKYEKDKTFAQHVEWCNWDI